MSQKEIRFTLNTSLFALIVTDVLFIYFFYRDDKMIYWTFNHKINLCSYLLVRLVKFVPKEKKKKKNLQSRLSLKDS